MSEAAARAKLRKFIAARTPQQLADAATEFERKYRADPYDEGSRIAYFALRSEIVKRFPVKYPEETEHPLAAVNDENHPYWTTDPACVFEKAFYDLVGELGYINTQIKVSKMQANGEKFPT